MRRKSLSAHGADFQEPTINITPLIDVVFVMLIAFIVVAPLLEVDRIELAKGDNLLSHLPMRFDDQSPIQIQVQNDNSIVLNNKNISLDELVKELREAKGLYPDARVQLFHHKDASFGTYQTVKNALECAEFENLDVVLIP